MSGQCKLDYFMDETKRRLKGSLDLDNCDQVHKLLVLSNCYGDVLIMFLIVQVDAYLTYQASSPTRPRYQWVFDLRLPKRIYYMAAENESEMNEWVHDLCFVCGLQRSGEQRPGETSESKALAEMQTFVAKLHCAESRPICIFHALKRRLFRFHSQQSSPRTRSYNHWKP